MAKGTKSYKREHGLTVAQQNAIDLLVLGKTDQEAADAVGVNRVTVAKWRLYDPWFQAELNRRRKELWADGVDRLRALIPKALDTLERELEQGEMGPRLALQILKLAGLERLGGSIGPDDPEQIIDAEVRRRRATQNVDLSDILSGGAIIDTERAAVVADLDEKARTGN